MLALCLAAGGYCVSCLLYAGGTPSQLAVSGDVVCKSFVWMSALADVRHLHGLAQQCLGTDVSACHLLTIACDGSEVQSIPRMHHVSASEFDQLQFFDRQHFGVCAATSAAWCM